MSKNIRDFFKKLSLSKLPSSSSSSDSVSSSQISVSSSQDSQDLNLHLSQEETIEPAITNSTEFSRSELTTGLNLDPATSTEPFNVLLKPIRPVLAHYLSNKYGCFKSKWYSYYSWLEYSKSTNAAFCFTCRHFGDNSSNKESTYTKDGFKNFKKATEKFKAHHECLTHKTAALMYANRLAQDDSCLAQINSQHKLKVKENRGYLAIIFQTLIWLCKQALPLRGHDEIDESKNRGNFLELLEFQCRYNLDLRSHCERTFNYTSPQIQNEMIEIIAKEIIKVILPSELTYFAIIADETMDIARHEQVSLCLRYIDEHLVIREHFVGFFRTSSTTAESLCAIILEALDGFGLDYKSKLVGQCYDGAANMSGVENGLHKKIRNRAKKALYVHCYAHQLNLALQHSCNKIKNARNVLDTLNTLHSFIECSSKGHSLFELIQDRNSVILKHLSDTRWASRLSSLAAMKASYGSVIKFLEIVDEKERNERGAKAAGLLRQIRDFDFLFYIYALNAVFEKSSVLSISLQDKTLDIAKGLDLAELTILKLKEIKNADGYARDLFEASVNFATEHSIKIPTLLNKAGRPSTESVTKKRRRDDALENVENLEEPDFEKYNVGFKNIVNIFVNHLSDKFNTDTYKPLIAIQSLLTSAEKPEISSIFLDLAIYRDDFNKDNLSNELDLWYI